VARKTGAAAYETNVYGTALLLDHAGQVVTKTELFAALWRGTAVSDGALTFCIVEIKALSTERTKYGTGLQGENA
jgi:DNA-binding response OmpR family regulator